MSVYFQPANLIAEVRSLFEYPIKIVLYIIKHQPTLGRYFANNEIDFCIKDLLSILWISFGCNLRTKNSFGKI
jgi:hypothetical protein